MSKHVHIRKEWRGNPLPTDAKIPLPTPAELVRLVNRWPMIPIVSGTQYPPYPDKPAYMVFHGSPLAWNRLEAQKLAHEELRRLGSPIKVPAVYYACQVEIAHAGRPGGAPDYQTYAVMEDFNGMPARDLLVQERDDEDYVNEIYSKMALALSDLHRISVPLDARPAAVRGGKIRYTSLKDEKTSFHYNNTTELEEHLNLTLSLVGSERRVKDLALEPMVFCYSEVWLNNFLIDQQGVMTVVDFRLASFLPSSFARHVIDESWEDLRRDISHLVHIPETEGIDNSRAVGEAARNWEAFEAAGKRLRSAYKPEKKVEKVRKLVVDAEGIPIEFEIPI